LVELIEAQIADLDDVVARVRGGVPLHSPRTRGARWIGRRGPNGRASTSAADRSEAGSSA
jgi:hypothetical protein